MTRPIIKVRNRGMGDPAGGPGDPDESSRTRGKTWQEELVESGMAARARRGLAAKIKEAEQGKESLAYGVRVKNPLTLPVRVEILQALPGKKKRIVGQAVVKPSATVFIPLERPGDYEVRTTLIRLAAKGTQEELGSGAWKVEGHEDVVAPPAKRRASRPEPEEEPPLRSLEEMMEELRKKEMSHDPDGDGHDPDGDGHRDH